MAERLAAAGHDVHLLTYGQGAQQAGRGYRHHRIARLPGDDATRSGPSLVKPLLDAMLARRLVALCRAHDVEIVHAHNYEAALAGLFARVFTGVPVVYHSHNLMGDELETYFEKPAIRRLAATMGRFLDGSVPRRADRVIALCDWSAERLCSAGCTSRALRVIPPAVEDQGPLVAEAGDRSALGLGVDDFVVGYCGNLDRYQNIEVLLRVVARMPTTETSLGPVRLLLASHAIPDDFRRVVAAAGLGERLRLVELCGHAQARRIVAVSDVVALPRRLGSGYPVKLLNSMSAAKPVITGGCGAKVLQDGIDGVVVADGDERAWVQGLDRCRREPRWLRDLGDAARRTYLGSLTWEKVLPQIEDVYEGLRESSNASAAGGPSRRLENREIKAGEAAGWRGDEA